MHKTKTQILSLGVISVALMTAFSLQAQAENLEQTQTALSTSDSFWLADVGFSNSAGAMLSSMGVAAQQRNTIQSQDYTQSGLVSLDQYIDQQQAEPLLAAASTPAGVRSGPNIAEPAKYNQDANLHASNSFLPPSQDYLSASEMPSFKQPITGTDTVAKRENSLAPVDFDVILGLGVASDYDYFGSDDRVYGADVLVDITYRDVLFLSTNDGLGFVPISNDTIFSNLHVNWRPGRDNVGDIKNMNYVNGGAVLGGAIGYKSPYVNFDMSFDWGVTGDNLGSIIEVEASKWVELGPVISVRPYAYINMGDDLYNQAVFGITADEATKTGFSAFKPNAGVIDYGAGVDVEFEINPVFALAGTIQAGQIAENMAKSDLIEKHGNRNQYSFALALQYRF